MNPVDFELFSALLADPERVAEIPRETIPATISQLSALIGQLSARQMDVACAPTAPANTDQPDLLEVKQAAQEFNVRTDWLYRNWTRYKFGTKVAEDENPVKEDVEPVSDHRRDHRDPRVSRRSEDAAGREINAKEEKHHALEPEIPRRLVGDLGSVRHFEESGGQRKQGVSQNGHGDADPRRQRKGRRRRALLLRPVAKASVSVRRTNEATGG